jgi:hypothetical protein
MKFEQQLRKELGALKEIIKEVLTKKETVSCDTMGIKEEIGNLIENGYITHYGELVIGINNIKNIEEEANYILEQFILSYEDEIEEFDEENNSITLATQMSIKYLYIGTYFIKDRKGKEMRALYITTYRDF